MSNEELEALHKRSSYHRADIERLGGFACFCCEERRPLREVREWIDDGQTAVCKCGVDACLPDDGTITSETLDEMELHWFGLKKRTKDGAQ